MSHDNDKRNNIAIDAWFRSGGGFHSPRRYSKADRQQAQDEIDEGLLEYEELTNNYWNYYHGETD